MTPFGSSSVADSSRKRTPLICYRNRRLEPVRPDFEPVADSSRFYIIDANTRTRTRTQGGNKKLLLLSATCYREPATGRGGDAS